MNCGAPSEHRSAAVCELNHWSVNAAQRELADGLKVQPHVREAILNHVSGYRPGAVGVDDESTYEAEKKPLSIDGLHILRLLSNAAATLPHFNVGREPWMLLSVSSRCAMPPTLLGKRLRGRYGCRSRN